MRRWPAWFVNGLLLLGAMGAALALTEVGVRLISPQPTGLSHQDRYGLGMHYAGISRYLPQFGQEVSINSAGMRDREHTFAKPPGVFRVLLLGDSFVEAVQVPFEASLPSLLEKELAQQTGRQVEVVSAGVSGWGTDDELRYLTYYGAKYQADLVVVAMTLHNDISDNLREEWHTMKDGALVEQPRPPMSSLRYKVVSLKAFIATRFQTYQLWRRVRHGGEMQQTGKLLRSHIVELFWQPVPDRIAWGFDFTRLLLAQMKEVAGAGGSRVALVLLPLRVQLSDSSFAAFVQGADADPSEMPAGAPQRVMTGIADSLGIPVIDLLPSFQAWTAESSGPLFLEWDGHWNEAGHRLAAEVAARGLVMAGALQ